MIRAYDEMYLENARDNLAQMLDFAVHDLHQDITDFFTLFIISGIADQFASGDPSVVVGRSGVELVYETFERIGMPRERITPKYTANRSKEYWTGWVLAHYQWYTSLSFDEIIRYVSITDIKRMYSPYHEMDIRQFIDKMNELIRDSKHDTNLKILRLRAGLSQSKLASSSGIPLRTIQQYEQRQKNINKAQGEYLISLAMALSCEPSDLIEKIQ